MDKTANSREVLGGNGQYAQDLGSQGSSDGFEIRDRFLAPTATDGSIVGFIKNATELRRHQKVKAVVQDMMGGGLPDAVVVLGAGVEQIGKTGRWRSVAWGAPGDLGLHTGARTRVVAGAEMAKVYPDATIITNSYNRTNSEEPTMASVAAAELERRGVEPERLLLEEDSFSTITQLIELLKIAEDKGWHEIAVIGNEYYQERLTALYENLPEIVSGNEEVTALWGNYRDRGGRVRFLNSEPILRAKSDRYAQYIDRVMRQPYYAEMLEKEAKGVADIKDGRYKYKLTPDVSRDK